MFNNILFRDNNFTQVWYEFIFTEIIFTSILFIILLPIAFIIKNRSPYWKFGLWSLIFLRLILPTNLNSPCNIWRYFDDSFISSWISIDPSSSQYSVIEDIFSLNTTVISTSEDSIKNNAAFEQSDQILKSFLLAGWLIGVIGLLMIFYRKKQLFKNIIQNSSKIDDDWIIRICQNWEKKFKLRRRIHIFASDKYLSPYTIGIIQPKIFIPQSVIDLKNEIMLKAVIGHELAHIKRFDALWTQLQFFIQVFFFFYPVVWYAGRQLNQAREGLCDLMVLRQEYILPKQYARSLIQILQFNSSGYFSSSFVQALGGNKHSLKLRINQIMENKIMKKKHTLFLIIFMTAIGFTSLPMASILDIEESSNYGSVNPEKSITFQLPIKRGAISSGFGNKMHPVKKVIKHHNGIDIAAATGTEVYAASDGKVHFADFQEDWGNKIVLIHETDFSSIYSQLSEILVDEGTQVKAGQLIGRVGSSGLSTGPHLHFEIRKKDDPVNPEELIEFSELKPLGQ